MARAEMHTLSDTLHELEQRGFKDSFEQDGAALRSTESGRRYDPADITVLEVYRFEGDSDPDDMSVVYAVRTRDGTQGTILDAFGTYGGASLGELVRGIKEARDHD